MSDELPYTLRWPKERKEYISCFCCPPNTLRTLCETQNYAYAVGKGELYVNLYGENTFTTKLDKKNELVVVQHTDYPWNGKVEIVIEKVKKNTALTFKLHIPAWADDFNVMVNGQSLQAKVDNGYVTVAGNWKKGDVITLDMPMETKLIEANPLVEEARGQVAVQRGPIVYCLESNDLKGVDIDNIAIPVHAKFSPVEINIAGSRMMALEGNVVNRNENNWQGQLYREVGKQKQQLKVRLIPYYAWGNRGKSEMTIWIPAVY